MKLLPINHFHDAVVVIAPSNENRISKCADN